MVSIQDFRDAPPRRQLALIAAAVAGIGLVLLAFYFLFLRSSYEPLFRELSVTDAARITAELEAQQIPYRLESEGSAILVPSDAVDGARLAVMSSDLPLESMVGFELFNESSLGLTEFAQRINYQRALQGELARTIMALETVDAARLHISMTEQTVFRGDRTPPSASVTVAPRPGRVLLPDTVSGIQHLIAAAVPDLNAADVVVLNEAGRVVSSSVPTGGVATPETRERGAMESYYAARIERELVAYRRDAEFAITVQLAGPLPAATTDPEDDPGVSAQPAAEDWTTGERSFGLIVTIATELAAEQSEAGVIRMLAARAIGSSPTTGDAIAVTVPRAAQAAEPSGPAPVEQPSPAPVATPPLAPSSDWLWALLVTSVGGLVFLVVRTMRKPAMSDAEREAFASRLGRLLDGEAASAAR